MASRKISAQVYTAIEDTGVSYNKKDVLGRGSFGTVFSGIFRGKPIAVKRIDITNLIDGDREVHLHTPLDHVNILRVLTVVEDDDFRYIALELCAGTLDEYINNKKKYKGPNLPADRVVLYEIANGLHHIHSKNLVHRDIKPENILISMKGEMKLSDFGLSKQTSSRGTFSLSGTKGTVSWMAPELLKCFNEYMEVRGTSSSDTFSTGCVFFTFLTRGIHPFGDGHLELLVNVEQNNSANFNKLDSKHFAAPIIRQMIHHDPLKRVSIEQVKKQLEPEVEKPDLPIKLSRQPHQQQPIFFGQVEKLAVSIKNSNVETSTSIRKLGEQKLERKEGANAASLSSSSSSSSITSTLLPDVDPFTTFEVSCTSFHPIDSVLACSLRDMRIVFLKSFNNFVPFSNWKITKELQVSFGEAITSILWNVTGTRLAAVCYDRMNETRSFMVWSYPEGKSVFQPRNLPSFAYDVIIIWNPFDCNVLASVSDIVQIWNSSTNGSFSHEIRSDSSINKVEWVSETRLAFALSRGVIEIHELDNKSTKSNIIKCFHHEDNVESVAWNEGSKLLASCSRAGWIKIWSMNQNEAVNLLKIPGTRCICLAWCPNRKTRGNEYNPATIEKPLIACGLGNRSIVIWSPMEKELLPSLLKGHSFTWIIDRVLFSPDGRFLSSTNDGNELIVWSTQSWNSVQTLKGKLTGHVSWDATSSKLTTIFEQQFKCLQVITGSP